MYDNYDNIVQLILNFTYRKESISFSVEDISSSNYGIKFSIHLFDSKIKSRYYSVANLDIEIFGNKIHISDIISRISNHNYGLELLNYLLLLTQEIMTVNKISIIYGELVEKDYTRWSQLYYIYNKLVSVNVSNISLHCFFDEEKLQSNSQRYVCDVSFGYILS